MNRIVQILSQVIDIKSCKNNKKIYVSKTCPFCGHRSKRRPFRYNTFLKVGKSYCCGKSFKEEYWLIKQLEDSDFIEKHERKTLTGVYHGMSEEEAVKYDKYMNDFKDKLDENFRRFEKSENDMPF